MLDAAALRDRGKKLATSNAKRREVHLIRERLGLREHRACDIVQIAGRVVRYKPLLIVSDNDTELTSVAILRCPVGGRWRVAVGPGPALTGSDHEATARHGCCRRGAAP